MSVRHRCYVGLTGSGKSFAAEKHLVQQVKKGMGAIFFNVQDLKLPRAFVRLKENTPTYKWVAGIKHGYGFNFVPSTDQDEARTQLKGIYRALEKARLKNKCVILVDEAPFISPQGGKSNYADQIALRGRSKNIEGWFLTQRCAALSKNIVTQCRDLFIFDIANDDALYLERKGYPGRKIVEQVRAAGEYHYCVYDNQIRGIYKE